MFKMVSAFLFIVGGFLFLIAKPTQVDACKETDLSRHVPIPPYEVESKREVFGLCEVIISIGGELIPVYAGRNFIIAGEMFSKREQITQKQMQKVREKFIKKRLSLIETLEYVSYKPEKAKGYFYFVSDPDCPYCERAKAKVKELADKYRWEIRLIWYPLPFHKEAKPKAIAHLCENKTYEDYLKNDYGKKQCERGKASVEKNLRVLSSIVRGTPTFIFPDGEVVAGLNLKKLERVLAR